MSNPTESTGLNTLNSTTENATQSVALSIGSALLDQVNPAFRAESQHLSIEADTTVAQVLERIGFPSEQSLLIVLNDTLVTRPAISTQQLTHGDSLAFMPPIHAG